MNRVYIIIVNWNGGRDTVECLESVFRLNYPRYSVVVCDNGSSDASLVVITTWAASHGLCHKEFSPAEAAQQNVKDTDLPLAIIKSEVNLGFAGGNNLGIRYAMARGDCAYVWLLNNDTVVEPDALTWLVKRTEQEPLAGMCGSTIRFYNEPDKIQALGGGYYCHWLGIPLHYGRFWGTVKKMDPDRAVKWMNYVEGASMLVTRRFLDEIGLMCEDYFLYFEEADWAIRASGRFQLAYAADSIVYHKVGGSIGTSSNPAKKSYLCDYFNIRNRIIFTRKFYPAVLPIIYFVLMCELVIRLFMGKWDRAVMIAKLMFGVTDRQHEIPSGCQARL